MHSASLQSFIMRQKQNTKMTSNHAGILESLCPAQHSLFKTQLSKIFITCISPASLRYITDAEDSLVYLCTMQLVFLASSPSLSFPCPNCYCSQSHVQGQLVQTGKTQIPGRPYCHRCITCPCSHCKHHCCCQTPPKYARMKNHCKSDDLQCFQSPQPSTFVPPVTSRQTGKSHDITNYKITFW